MEAELRTRAMGSDLHLVVHGPSELLELGRAEVERLEQLWSRFRPDSEISRLNEASGAWLAVSPETMTLLERAREGWWATGGRFDPTVLGDVVAAGYDRSFELLDGDDLADRSAGPSADRPAAGPTTPAPARTVHGAAGIVVDRERGAARLPGGVAFDPGGIGKGLAADLVTATLDEAGAAGALVNLGGDLRAVGYGPRGDDWTVAVDPADLGDPLATLILRDGAVATSTTLRRRWRVGGVDRHHLIDPATGEPTDGDVVAATVIAAQGWQAEVLAKAALVGGVDAGLALVQDLGADALLVDRMGGLHPSAGFDRFRTTGRPASTARSVEEAAR